MVGSCAIKNIFGVKRKKKRKRSVWAGPPDQSHWERQRENGFAAQPQRLFPIGTPVLPRAPVIIDWGERLPADGQAIGKSRGTEGEAAQTRLADRLAFLVGCVRLCSTRPRRLHRVSAVGLAMLVASHSGRRAILSCVCCDSSDAELSVTVDTMVKYFSLIMDSLIHSNNFID